MHKGSSNNNVYDRLGFRPLRGPELPFHFKSLEHIACFCHLELFNNQVFLQFTIVFFTPLWLSIFCLSKYWFYCGKICIQFTTLFLSIKFCRHFSIFTVFCNYTYIFSPCLFAWRIQRNSQWALTFQHWLCMKKIETVVYKQGLPTKANYFQNIAVFTQEGWLTLACWSLEAALYPEQGKRKSLWEDGGRFTQAQWCLPFPRGCTEIPTRVWMCKACNLWLGKGGKRLRTLPVITCRGSFKIICQIQPLPLFL